MVFYLYPILTCLKIKDLVVVLKCSFWVVQKISLLWLVFGPGVWASSGLGCHQILGDRSSFACGILILFHIFISLLVAADSEPNGPMEGSV
jgi:hypothetical protein